MICHETCIMDPVVGLGFFKSKVDFGFRDPKMKIIPDTMTTTKAAVVMTIFTK